MKRNRLSMILAVTFSLFASVAALPAQTAQTPVAEHDKAPRSNGQAPGEASSATAGTGTAKDAPSAQESARQAKILEDTNKLYSLVQELKVEVSKSSKDTLSLSVIKKASEIEKLAKSLKERMRPQ